MDWDTAARRQGGIIAGRQLTALGLTRAAVRSMLGRRILVKTEYRGLYRAAGAPKSPDAEAWLTVQNESGRWGNRQLSQLLRDSRPGAEAESERLLHKLLRDARIGGWHPNLAVVVGGRCFRLDVAFPDQLLDVEVDGWAFHRSKDRRDQDMARANALTAAGWRVLTFSWEDVRYRPDYVVQSIVALLTARVAS